MECCNGRQWPMSHCISADNKGAAVDLEAIQTARQYPLLSRVAFPFEGATDASIAGRLEPSLQLAVGQLILECGKKNSAPVGSGSLGLIRSIPNGILRRIENSCQ
jgi:hypothetical protein